MASISGFWAGTYAYPNDSAPSVNFDCEMQQSGGVIAGQITESHRPGQMLLAHINGQISGSNISFFKRYKTADSNYRWGISYVGEVSAKKDKITGIWRAGGRQGTFEMHRDAGQLVGAEVRETSLETNR